MLDWNERANCAVRAVAHCTSLPYRVVHAEFAKSGRRTGGRAPYLAEFPVIRRLGFIYELWEVNAKTIRTVEKELPTSGAFLISVRGHLLARVNGITHDWSRGTLRRVQGVCRVRPKPV